MCAHGHTCVERTDDVASSQHDSVGAVEIDICGGHRVKRRHDGLGCWFGILLLNRPRIVARERC